MTSRPQRLAPDAGPGQKTEAASADRYVLLIEGIDLGDALLRVLGLVSVQQARVRDLRFDCADGRFQARLEVEGLEMRRARRLSLRLAQLPLVDSVSFGWRGCEKAPGRRDLQC